MSLDGRQIKNNTLSLSKLKGGLITFTSSATMSFDSGAVLRTSNSNIIIGTDVVNKNYVDNLNLSTSSKKSVRAIFNGSITSISGYIYDNGSSGIGASLNFNTNALVVIDGQFLNSGDRVIVNSTTDQFVNGIYIYGPTNSFYVRSLDFNGSTDISGGEYTFVKTGASHSDTGWVVQLPNNIATIGSTNILWTQFSSPGVIYPGDGISQVGTTFNVDVSGGLTISSDRIIISNTSVSPGSYGGLNVVPILDINSRGQVVSAYTQSVQIPINNGLEFIDNYIGLGGSFSRNVNIDAYGNDVFLNDIGYFSLTSSVIDLQADGLIVMDAGQGNVEIYADLGITIFSASGSVDLVGDSSLITTTNGQGLVYNATYSPTFVTHSLVDKQYVDNLFITARPYTSYVAGISQNGTASPVADYLNENSVGSLTFSRTDLGVFSIQLPVAYGASKVRFFHSLSVAYYDSEAFIYYSVSGDVISFSVLSLPILVPTDNFIMDIEIRVYP